MNQFFPSFKYQSTNTYEAKTDFWLSISEKKFTKSNAKLQRNITQLQATAEKKRFSFGVAVWPDVSAPLAAY